MLEYGFFNSVNGDRKYTADSINSNLSGFLSDTGVYKEVGLGLKVLTGLGGMRVTVGTGKARIKKYFVNNTTQQIVALEKADMTLNRWDAIVLSLKEEERLIEFNVIRGISAAVPERPEPKRTADRHDIVLAYVYVAAGAENIEESNVVDTRENKQICGYIRLLVDVIDAGIEKYRLYFNSQNKAEYTIAEEETEGDSPENIDPDTDVILVDIEGLLLTEGKNYTAEINNAGSLVITFTQELDADNRITLTWIKPVVKIKN